MRLHFQSVLRWLALALFITTLAFSRLAGAQTIAPDAARVNWTNATTLVDGAAIPAPPDPLSLAQTTIQRSVGCTATNFGTVAQTINVLPAVLTVLYENLRPAGKHCFRARHVQTSGDVSNWTGVVSKNITVPVKARPPTITIQ